MQKVFLDGKFVDEVDAKVSVFDHAVLYGDGIFEGIRAYNNRVFQLDAHVDRFFQAAKAIALGLPYTKEEVKQVVLESCKVNGVKNGYVRLVATRGKGSLGISPTSCSNPTVFCIAGEVKLYPEELYQTGMPIITASVRRNSSNTIDPQVKSLNYLNNVLASIEAARQGVEEALMLTRDGYVAECTGDNVFVVKNGEIWTPPTYLGTLDGITRRNVIKLAKQLGYVVHEEPFTLFNVYNADECFLTGTAAEAIAITKVDNRVIGSGVCGKVTAELRKAFHEYACSKEAGTEIK